MRYDRFRETVGMTSLMFESLELRAGELVLEEAVVGPSSKEVFSATAGVHRDATKPEAALGKPALRGGDACVIRSSCAHTRLALF